MENENTPKKPEIVVIAGPNGSGKSTITKLVKVIEPYINADDIKKSLSCSDLDAAKIATKMREDLVAKRESFTFETVLSTTRNIELLEKAKAAGFFVRCVYILTRDPQINLMRIKTRAKFGGHDVPAEKVASRYKKALLLIPRLVKICDVCHIYDNTTEPFRIFKKRKSETFFWENEFWNLEQIKKLVF